MASHPFLLLMTTAMVLLVLVITPAAAQAPAPSSDGNVLQPVGPTCSTTGNYTSGSQYQKNLAELLAALPAAAAGNGWFYNGTAGAGADRVYGLIMCFADRNETQCRDCLTRAPAGVAAVCPGSRSVSAAYDACVLRYSDEPFFGAADPAVAFFVFQNTGAEVDDPESLDVVREHLIGALATAAAESPLRLANGSAPCAGSEEDMYGLAQCTRDLTSEECAWCLNTYVERLGEVFGDCTGGATKGYSCYVRYSLGAFDITLPPSPSPSPPTPSTPSPPASPPSAPPSPPTASPPTSPPPSPPTASPPTSPPSAPPSPPTASPPTSPPSAPPSPPTASPPTSPPPSPPTASPPSPPPSPPTASPPASPPPSEPLSPPPSTPPSPCPGS